MKSVTILSRRDAMRYCYGSHPFPSVMISISDPCMVYETAPFFSPANRVLDILRLTFADADGVGSHVWVPQEAAVPDRIAAESDLMTREDAAKVAQFLSRHPNRDVIVHCDAGLSRSAGVAAAIMKHFNGDDSPVFDSGKYYPNMWCYRLTLEALENKEE